MQLDSSATQIEHRDERLGRVEAERATSDHPQAIVRPLDNPIGEALPNIGEHPLLLGPDGSRDPDKGRELGTARPREPVIEGPAGPLGLPVVQRAGQGLVQEVRRKSWTLLRSTALSFRPCSRVRFHGFFSSANRVPLVTFASSGSPASRSARC